jgi:NAD(P)H-hydrate repair Nnr-like enzyme with NAD(P)H-hydrate dehydratase domain
MHDYWERQEIGKPLFPDIIWSRPETKHTSGKLLIIGGNAHGFATAAEAYQIAISAGAGSVRVLLPEALRKIVGGFLETAEYAPSNPSGSFAKAALAELIADSDWSDAILLSGELGRNSETAIVLEEFIQKYHGQLTVTRDAIDYFYHRPELLLKRPNTCIVGSTGQLQKLAIASHFDKAITTSLNLVQLVEILHEFARKYSPSIITNHLGTTIVVAEGKISTTKTGTNEDIWRVPTAARSSVFWMQHLSKTFEALTTSLV